MSYRQLTFNDYADNDAAIGNKNRINAERALRNRNSVQNRHVKGQCKVLPSLMNTKSLVEDTDLSSSNMDNKSGQKGKDSTKAVPLPSQRRYVRTGKSIKT